MKKTLLALTIAATSSAPALSFADTILGLYAGAGQWQSGLGGEIGDQNGPTSVDTLGYEDKDGTVIWAKFEHPVPFVPNVMLRSTSLSSSSSKLFGDGDVVNLGGTDLGGQISTDLDLSHIDATLYYEILDNWVTLDVGLSAKMFSGHLNAYSDANDDGTVDLVEKNDISGTVPMLYLSAQFDLPLSGFHVGANTQALSLGDNSIVDTSIYAGYMGDLIPLFDIGINVGYRDLSITLEEDDEIYVDAGFDGLFLELIAHF